MTALRRGPALFLDRDGSLIEEVGYLSHLKQMRLLPGAAEAVRTANEAGMPVVVVSNQSGVARGLIDEDFVERSGAHLRELLESAGARLDAIYTCPHHPAGNAPYNIVCPCRKPAPGMIERACRDLALSPDGAFMIGDKVSDVETGKGLGIVPLLVRTGFGRGSERELPADFARRGGRVFDDLAEAVDWAVGTQPVGGPQVLPNDS